MSTQFTNFGSTTLTSGISNSDTSITVNDGSKFPGTGDFYVTCEDEIIKVTARSGNVLTAVRAQYGTTAASHASSAPINLNLPKEVLENFFAERISVGGYASRPATGREGQEYYANDIDLAWRHTGSNWDLIHPVYVPYANRVDLTGWTVFNQGTSTWTNFNGVLHATMPLAGGVDNLRGYSKNLPSAPYTINTIIRPLLASEQYNGCGIALHDGTKFYTNWALSNNVGELISVDTYSNSTTYNGGSVRQASYAPGPIWLRIEDDNTNWNFYRSYNGKDWNKLFNVARNTYLTATKVALFADKTDSVWTTSLDYQFLAYWET